MTRQHICLTLGNLALDLTWLENSVGAWDIERTWNPVAPDILPDGIKYELAKAVRDYLDRAGWPMPAYPFDLDLAWHFVGLAWRCRRTSRRPGLPPNPPALWKATRRVSA